MTTAQASFWAIGLALLAVSNVVLYLDTRGPLNMIAATFSAVGFVIAVTVAVTS